MCLEKMIMAKVNGHIKVKSGHVKAIDVFHNVNSNHTSNQHSTFAQGTVGI